MKKAILLILAVFSFGAFSGQSVGNGGDVITCESKQPFEIQLLDYYSYVNNQQLLRAHKLMSAPQQCLP